MVYISITTSVVAGIHRTKVGSHPRIKLVVEDDDSVQEIDPNCMLVRHPLIHIIQPELHRDTTYPKSRNPRDPRQENQLAYEVAGRKVGNVPTKLCGLFRRMKSAKKVEEIHWLVLYSSIF